MYKNACRYIKYMFPESPVCKLYDDSKRNGFRVTGGDPRCNRSAQGLKMANCTSFKILTPIPRRLADNGKVAMHAST